MKQMIRALVLLPLMGVSASVLAQVDAGALLRESQQQAPELPTLPVREAPPKPAVDTGKKVLVKGFDVRGSTRYGPEVWNNLLKDMQGEELGFNGMRCLSKKMSEFLKQPTSHLKLTGVLLAG